MRSAYGLDAIRRKEEWGPKFRDAKRRGLALSDAYRQRSSLPLASYLVVCSRPNGHNVFVY